jgi:hypothetical protein
MSSDVPADSQHELSRLPIRSTQTSSTHVFVWHKTHATHIPRAADIHISHLTYDPFRRPAAAGITAPLATYECLRRSLCVWCPSREVQYVMKRGGLHQCIQPGTNQDQCLHRHIARIPKAWMHIFCKTRCLFTVSTESSHGPNDIYPVRLTTAPMYTI